MMQARLEELDPESRRLLRAASVFGQSFWEGGVLTLLGGRRTPAFDAALSRRSPIASCSPAARRAASPASRSTASVTPSCARPPTACSPTTTACSPTASRASGWSPTRTRTPPCSPSTSSAATIPSRARRWYVRAAEQALGGNDLTAVIETAERGIRCGARGEDFALLRLLQAEAHQWRGEHAEVTRRSAEAMSSLPRGSSLWYRAVAEAARAHGRLGARVQLEALAHDLAATPADPSILPDYAAALASASIQLMFGGRHALAAALLDRAEELSRHMIESDPILLGRLYYARSVRAACTGDIVGDLAASEAAVAELESAGDFRGSCHSLVNVGYSYSLLGEYERAVQHLTRALAQAERTGTFLLTAFAKHNLGLSLARLGRFDERRRRRARGPGRRARAGRRAPRDRRVRLPRAHPRGGRRPRGRRDPRPRRRRHRGPRLAHVRLRARRARVDRARARPPHRRRRPRARRRRPPRHARIHRRRRRLRPDHVRGDRPRAPRRSGRGAPASRPSPRASTSSSARRRSASPRGARASSSGSPRTRTPSPSPRTPRAPRPRPAAPRDLPVPSSVADRSPACRSPPPPSSPLPGRRLRRRRTARASATAELHVFISLRTPPAVARGVSSPDEASARSLKHVSRT